MTIYSLDILLFLFGTGILFHVQFSCFLTCIQVLKRQVRWSGIPISFRIFQFIVSHTVKGFGIVNKAETDVFFWNSLAVLMIQWMLAIWSLAPLPFLKPTGISGISRFTYCWTLAWKILFEYYSYCYSVYNVILLTICRKLLRQGLKV